MSTREQRDAYRNSPKGIEQAKRSRDAHKARHKVRFATDPEYREKCRAKERRHQVGCRLRRKYGITVAQRDAMLNEQGGRCASCSRAVTVEPGNVTGARAQNKAVVDHCHATGKVRGILCNGCNIGIGAFADAPERLEAGAAYLRRHA